MPKTHQPEGIVLVLGAINEFRYPVDGADFAEHLESCFVCAAMRRSPETSNTSSDAGEWIGARRPGETDG